MKECSGQADQKPKIIAVGETKIRDLLWKRRGELRIRWKFRCDMSCIQYPRRRYNGFRKYPQQISDELCQNPKEPKQKVLIVDDRFAINIITKNITDEGFRRNYEAGVLT